MALGRPRRTKVPKNFKYNKDIVTKIIICERGCGRHIQVFEDVISVTCWECCSHMAPEVKAAQPKEKTGFPRGWKLYKEYVTQDGVVYHKGVENPKLKGTLKPTVIKEPPKLSKHEKRKIKEEKEIKKMQRLAKQHQKKMKAKNK